MSFVVTGGAGFIGSNISEQLSKINKNVLVLDNFTTGNLKNISFLDRKQWVHCDILDYDKLKSNLNKDDIVLHHAALTSVPESYEKKEMYTRVNVDGNDVPISSKLGFGGGFLFEIPIDHRQRVGLELDLLIMNRKFNTNLVGGLETDSMTFINVPILLRAWVGKVLNVGIGWYFARGIGGVTRSMVDTSVSTSFGGVGIHAYDYGALAALCINVPFRNLSWFIEGRYQYGFFDAATGAADQWKNRDSQLLLGLRLGRQR